MKQLIRRAMSIVLCCLLVCSGQLTYAVAQLDANGIPTEVANHVYVEIPVYQEGKLTSVLSQYMEKGARKGYANIYVRAFAYQTGTSIKLGVLISYLGEDGIIYKEFFDAIGVDQPDEVNWPSCEGIYLEKNGDFKYEHDGDNERRIIVPFRTSNGEAFSRHTEQNVLLEAAQDTVNLKTLDGGIKEIDAYSPTLSAVEPYKNKKVFDEELWVMKDSTIQIDLNMETSELSKEPVYQFIQSDTVPTVPVAEGEWSRLGAVGNASYNNKENFADYDPEGGKISVQHYLFTGSYETTPSIASEQKKQYSRTEIFKYPVGDVVKQSTELGNNTTYSTQADKPAFFGKGSVTQTTLYATLVPKETGTYYFCVKNDSSAEGTITIDGTKQTLLEVSKNRGANRGNYKAFNLNVGQSYEIELTTNYKYMSSLAPCFMYSLNSTDDFKLVTPDILVNQNPTNGSCRAAKLWGFIEPDTSGVYHLGMLADDGAYGYINVKGENIVFVDNFGITAAVDQSNNVQIELEKGKVYPIYMEWYEGAPELQALTPRYKEVDSSEWKDIPANWFHPSKNHYVATHDEAVYEPTIISGTVNIPNEGRNYLVLKLTDKMGIEHQVLYGPFQVVVEKTIEEVKPTQGSDGNYVVPTSLSNVNTTIVYQMDSKAIQYEIDLSKIVGLKTTQGKDCLNVKLSDVIVQITHKIGETEMPTVLNSSTLEKDGYKMEIDGSVIKIKLTNEDQIVCNGESHIINVYYPTQFDSEMQYGPAEKEGTYLELLKQINADPDAVKKVQLTISRRPKIIQYEKNGVTYEEFIETPIVDKVDIAIEMREIPKVY